ncbi:serine protease [Thalassobacter stenotrophicus]|uniref:S1 family peptidase n=1 Tax=Thalassobacter stenotrophicus TaxID=266809 RepID=UPI00051FCDA6|nr:serine protease [Thalassobacter stenotrophicus]KGK78364.1 serine protease [Thalassobacter stenotrophicus]
MRRFLLVLALFWGMAATPTVIIAQDYQNLFRDFRSSDLSRADRRFLQAALAFEGHYNGLLDGDWGPISQRALEQYARQEFGAAAEDWHMAALAFSFFDIYERDGWAVRQFEALGLSMLYPFDAVRNEPPSENLVNWRHTNSSVGFSMGILDLTTAQMVHDYTESTHGTSAEPYILRRDDIAITSAERPDGKVLYTRSNYLNGAWSTIMLSANRRDVSVLNAIAASISVGYAQPVVFSKGGKLEKVVLQTVALLADEGANSQETLRVPQDSEPQKSSGTGFVVSATGHILTNAHVVKGCQTLTFEGQTAKQIAVSLDFDLALLHVHGWTGVGIAEFSPAPARLNSDVTVAGYPLAGILAGLNITRGAVSSQMGLGGDVSGMQITAPVQPGNSGGPVLAMDGEVVGVVVSKLDAQAVADAMGDIPQNVNFAIRGEIAKLFLFQHGVEPILGTSDERLSPVELADVADDFTGFIECN